MRAERLTPPASARSDQAAPGPGSAPRPTLANVQALRAIASVMVILVHLEHVFGSMGARSVDTAMFTAGVDLFFVISGFIMVFTTSRRPPTPKDFLLNRIARLVPIYWTFTLLAFLVALIAPRLLGGTVAEPLDLLRSLLFIPYARHDGLMRPILFVGWSLNLEMMFYVLFALSLALPRALPRAQMLMALLAALVGWHLAAGVGTDTPAGFLTQPLILEFGVGMLVGLAMPWLPDGRKAGLVAAFAAPVALAVLLWCSRHPAALFLPSTTLPATVLLVCALVAERSGLRLDRGWILALGDASYALYLIHPFVTQATTKAAIALGVLSAWTAPWLVLVAVAVSIGVALIVHRRIERPLGRVSQRLLFGPNRRPSPA